MRFKLFEPKYNNKAQQKKRENARPVKYVACKKCHRSNVTLIRGTDSYYCKDCYTKIKKKEK